MTRAHIGLAAVIIFEIVILFAGCHGGNSNPIAPGSGPDSAGVIAPADTVGDDTLSREGTAPPPVLWGLYRVAYNAETHEIESVPVRAPMDAFNVLTFMQPPMGSPTSMTIGVLDDTTFYENGRMDVRIILHHPFPGEPVYTGFDVHGIFLTEGTSRSAFNQALTYATPNVDPIMLNPDGYTRWMNPTEFLGGGIFGFIPGYWGTSESSENSGFIAAATLNPYKYFAQGLGPDDDLYAWLSQPGTMEERGIFRAGAGCGRDYQIQFPIVDDRIVFTFDYAILANWVDPGQPVTDPLTDFPPEANAGWPIFVFAEDNSNAYYTDGDAGGSLSLDLQITDRNAPSNPHGVPGEVSKFVVWSDDPLIPGDFAEFMSTEVEWNSGFTASTSVATIELDAMPESSGDIPVWVEIQSTNPSRYDQGYGVHVPSDPLAAYVNLLVDVKTCPKAGSGEVQDGEADSGEYLDDVTITGENFVEGPELGFWLELLEGEGESGEGEEYTIEATDVRFVDSNTVTADFDLSDAPFGDYGLGCTNGCGTVTEPEENYILGPIPKIQINIEKPLNLTLVTNRQGHDPQPLESLTLSWNPVEKAYFYRIYGRFYDINGNAIGGGSVIGTSNNPQKVINLSSLPNGPSGIAEFWVTALPGLLPKEMEYESKESPHAFAYMQDFETGIGDWEVRQENTEWRFIRSTIECAYDGTWGLKTFDHPRGPRWVLIASPALPDFEGADEVKVEFVHCMGDIDEPNGYQVGWLYNLPTNGMETVEGYYPISTVVYGQSYNDLDSEGLRSEFGISTYTDNNFQYDGWTPWYFSGYDLSEILGDQEENYIVIAAATNAYDHAWLAIDDIVILIY
jgi:hypothetical protein